MATSTLTITANTSGAPGGQLTVNPLATQTTVAVLNEQSVAVSTNTTITVPSNTTWLVIVPPNGISPAPNPNYAGTLTLKGVSGDTGITISNWSPTVLTWGGSNAASPSPPANFVINASPATTVYIASS